MLSFRDFSLAVLLAGALGVAAPASGGTATDCWDNGGAPGLFNWSSAPAIACRESARSTTAPQAAKPAVPRTTPGQTASVDDSAKRQTTFTFSGKAYFGIAASF